MVSIHQYFGLYDGDEIGFLTEGGVERKNCGVCLNTAGAWDPVANGDYSSPFGKARAHFAVFVQPVAKSVKAFGELFAGMSGHLFRARVDLDAGNDAGIGQSFCKERAVFLLLADCLVEENGAVEAITQSGGCDDHLAIGTTHFLILRNAGGGETFVAGWRALVHGEQAFIASDKFMGGVA